jgi:hypothetical protein
MASIIPDLWPVDIKVTVLPPLAILKAQEGRLAQRTQGQLQAKLTSVESDRLVQYQLDLIAPSLNFYRERLLTATHERGRYYPVVVTAECFAERPRNPAAEHDTATMRAVDPSVTQRRAATEEEFTRLLREVLKSDEVRSLIDSLLARINELPPGDDTTGNGHESTSPDRARETQANPPESPQHPE